jgi:hypothetical protein
MLNMATWIERPPPCGGRLLPQLPRLPPNNADPGSQVESKARTRRNSGRSLRHDPLHKGHANKGIPYSAHNDNWPA